MDKFLFRRLELYKKTNRMALLHTCPLHLTKGVVATQHATPSPQKRGVEGVNTNTKAAPDRRG